MNQHISTAQIGVERARLYRGIYSRVADKLRVSRSVVRRVAVGKGKSRRIEIALQEELRRIERCLVKFEKRLKRERAA